jgi:hypothetical protein
MGFKVTVNYIINHALIAKKIPQTLVVAVPDAKDIHEACFGAGQAFAIQMQEMTGVVGEFNTEMQSVIPVEMTEGEQAEAEVLPTGPFTPGADEPFAGSVSDFGDEYEYDLGNPI